MSVPGPVGLLLVAVLALSTNGNASNLCMRTFHEFEKAVIFDNPDNVDTLAKAFYKVNSPSPLSVRVGFLGNSSNETEAFISANPNCPRGRRSGSGYPRLCSCSWSQLN